MSETDDLYGLALEEFVPARDALAKELGGADGKAVRALRKPSVAAWCANQAVRSQPKAARELWAAGDALRDAHAAIVAGRGGHPRAAAARPPGAPRPPVPAGARVPRAPGPAVGAQTPPRGRAEP